MLAFPPFLGHGGALQTNLGVGSVAARDGTTVTASGTVHTKGSWSSLIDPTTFPSYGVWVGFTAVHAANTNTSLLVDIGYGPTGGGSEQVVLPDLNAFGAHGNTYVAGRWYYFPVYIPSGVRVSGRCQAVTASDTVVVTVFLEQDPLYANPAGGVLAYGVDSANSRGTSVPCASNAFGAWTQITSSTTRPHRFWGVGLDLLGDSSEATSDAYIIELGVGPDSSNVSRIYYGKLQSTTAEIIGPQFPLLSYAPVAAAKALWARLARDHTENRGVIIYGVD